MVDLPFYKKIFFGVHTARICRKALFSEKKKMISCELKLSRTFLFFFFVYSSSFGKMWKLQRKEWKWERKNVKVVICICTQRMLRKKYYIAPFSHNGSLSSSCFTSVSTFFVVISLTHSVTHGKGKKRGKVWLEWSQCVYHFRRFFFAQVPLALEKEGADFLSGRSHSAWFIHSPNSPFFSQKNGEHKVCMRAYIL